MSGAGPAPVPAPSADPLEAALVNALARAAEAGRFDVVAQLAKELEARRLARSGNVVVLDPRARRGRWGEVNVSHAAVASPPRSVNPSGFSRIGIEVKPDSMRNYFQSVPTKLPMVAASVNMLADSSAGQVLAGIGKGPT